DRGSLRRRSRQARLWQPRLSRGRERLLAEARAALGRPVTSTRGAGVGAPAGREHQVTAPVVLRRRASASADLEGALAAAVGGDVRFDAYTRHLYSTDA